MLNILNYLLDRARDKAFYLPENALVLRGLRRCDYILRLYPTDPVFNLHYLLAQTVGQGCSYYDPTDETPILDESLLGKNVLKTDFASRAFRVATLDAVYYSFGNKPTESRIITGTNTDKAKERAAIVCQEAVQLLTKRRPKHANTYNILNIGVVGSFLSILTSYKHQGADITVTASDFYEGVVGTYVHGVKIEDGNGRTDTNLPQLHKGARTLDLVAQADVAIITGMSLANNTLDGILEAALLNKTSMVVFAETGAHFASEYCEIGFDAVVSEPFPFYLTCDGPTQINIYRKDSH